MKILFWILALLSFPAGCFVSFTSYLSHGLDLYGTGFGEVVCILGMLALPVCIFGAVLGIRSLRKGNAKKAVVFALMGLVFSGIIIAGIYIDDAIHTVQFEKELAARNEQLYGENWDAPPAIDGIPKLYQKVLNKYYAVIRDTWPADRLMDLGAVSMPDYYGDAPLDNIGFVLMDLNGDDVDELIIGCAESTGTLIFCIYENTENPSYVINSVEGKTYYLHPGKTAGTYAAEIVGHNAAWEITPATARNTFAFTLSEGAMDPADRMTLELIPFSQYK